MDLLITQPYGSMEGYLVFCVFVICCLFVCTVMDFSAAEKARGVKFCMRVGLLSGQVSPLLDIKGRRERSRSPGTKTCLALRSPTRLPYKWYARAANGCCCGAGGRAHFMAGEG